MRLLLPPSCGLAAVVLLGFMGCGNLESSQADIAGGPGPVIAVGGTSGGGQSNPDGGGGNPGSGGLGGVVCLPPGASAACVSCEATVCSSNAFIYGCMTGTPVGAQCILVVRRDGGTGDAGITYTDGGIPYDAANYDPGTVSSTGMGSWGYGQCYSFPERHPLARCKAQRTRTSAQRWLLACTANLRPL